MKSRNYVIVVAALLIAMIAAVSTTPESISAYQKNQAQSLVNECPGGDKSSPNCANNGPQTQADVTAGTPITFQISNLVKEGPIIPPPSPPSEPQTCTECFRKFLSPEQIAEFESLAIPGDDDLELICAGIEGAENQMEILQDLADVLESVLEVDELTIEQIIDCLERVLGLQTVEPLE
jgi:hypothetical protein